jgi:hypothetical protein
MGYAWIGRIRNRDMVRPSSGESGWHGCKTLYAKADCAPRDLGRFHYVRCNPVACRLVLIKKRSKGRHRTTVHGRVTRSAHSLKQAKAQKEPWLLAVSPQLAGLSAKAIVAIYSGRMQIEQSFRDTKNSRRGLGLSESQSQKPKRLATLLLIGALACYALWLVGLAVRSSGYRIEFGSRKRLRRLSQSFHWHDGGSWKTQRPYSRDDRYTMHKNCCPRWRWLPRFEGKAQSLTPFYPLEPIRIQFF